MTLLKLPLRSLPRFGRRSAPVTVLLGAIFIVLLAAACSTSPTATAVPKQPTAVAPPAAAALFKPTQADLAGGSPDVFAKVFQSSNSTSKFPAASTYAQAAQPMAAGQKLKIGFIYVGSERDLGYNQAAYEGSLWMEKALKDKVEVIHAENIPETAQVQAVQEQMIAQGAMVIFATSYGYSASTKEMAKKHPGVIFLHQGDLESLQNYAAYFGNIWQLEYAAGIAAGKMTKSNKLGFVAAFPIPQTLLNVNAFTLGARSVNAEATTTFLLLGDWCDPAKQAVAFKTMLDAGVDVITQHQDCTKTIVEAAERAGIYVTGYHFDGSGSAPNAWLTGAAWNWGPIYTGLVSEILNGSFRTNVLFAGLEAGWVKLAPFGSKVPADVKKLVEDTTEGLRSGIVKPFTGPIKDQSGTVRIAAGAQPEDAELQQINWLVEGVVGSTK